MNVDRQTLEQVLVDLLRTDTQVPPGETEIFPGDPRIKAAVSDVVVPFIARLEPDEVRRHEMGDVAARFGPDSPDGLLIQTYIVSQHANLMDDPNSGSIVDGEAYGLEGPCAVGQGATQNKGPMASAIAAVGALPESLQWPVWIAVNTEGKSSHDGSRRVIDDLGIRAAQGMVAFGTDLRVSLGNRGRVDVEITVKGRSSHSSQPWLGSNPIEGAADVVRALRNVKVADEHPELGKVTITPYQLRCSPVAPHTIPETAVIVVDRRLLPGEKPAEAVAALRTHLASEGLDAAEVVQGEWMLPAVVSENAPIVRHLLDGVSGRGRPGESFWSHNAFDAGYACSVGIPTPMFGPGKRLFAGEGLVGTDAVSVGDCEVAANAILHAATALCA